MREEQRPIYGFYWPKKNYMTRVSGQVKSKVWKIKKFQWSELMSPNICIMEHWLAKTLIAWTRNKSLNVINLHQGSLIMYQSSVPCPMLFADNNSFIELVSIKPNKELNLTWNHKEGHTTHRVNKFG